MNHGTDPPPTSPSWHQVSIHFEDYSAAEDTAVTHLGPVLAEAETAGLVTSWFFIRKAPCWRLRFRSSHPSTERDAMAFLHQQLTTLHTARRIASWVETSYEPEMYAFGGAVAMDLAHHLFHADSRHILVHLAATSRDHRRELSILLCSTLMRAAAQDWYEQGDIWARVAKHRSLPPDTPRDRLRAMESDLRRFMTVDSATLMTENGPLRVLSDWAVAFAEAGNALDNLARHGTLHRGIRAVLTHHVIFHWNRLGLPHTTQAILANVATTAVLGQ